ncbi:Integrin alpha-9 [Ilyodon furcidens]|uniref:Integrin alpha-9 n=1 Tax=Ilyodon furcidens TaxID=33524 RepID=A0ABV0TGH2_9TELE
MTSCAFFCACVLCMCIVFKCDPLNLVVFQLVFEALHSQEPRGYVVGWIIAISLLVGILIFLLLAVLLWKMGFFRRHYREIIEAEKNRKDSDESWDWMDKDH